MLIALLRAWAPFLLFTFGPYIAIRVFVRSPLPRRLALWAWRTWFVGYMLFMVMVVGGAMVQTPQGTAVAQNFYSGSAGNFSVQKNFSIVPTISRGIAPANFLQMTYRIADELGHAVEAELMMGIIQQESAWNPDALSPAGAMGLAQLMPGTAAELGVTDPFDPEQSIRGGMRYIAWLLDYYDGDLETAVMAYHAGPGNMDTRGATSLDRYYAQRVLGYYEDYRAKASVGLLRHVGIGTEEACSIGPLYEYARLTQGSHGQSYGHDAIDLSAGPGTPLYAPITGEITERYVDGINNTVLVIENDCWVITLLHGDYTAKLGSQVQQGWLIGFEGNNGNTWSGGRQCFGADGCGDHAHLNMFNKPLQRNVNPLQYAIVQTWVE